MTNRQRYEAVVIGASLGGLALLKGLLPALPADYPLALILVQHLGPQAESTLAALLDRCCAIRVKEADEKEPIRPATLYVAPANYHLLVERDRSFSLSVDERVNYARPAIDVLFESAADAYGPALVGLVLTGANADGALGLRAIRARGGLAVVQDPATAEAPAMPRAAIAQARPQRVLAPAAIEALLLELARKG